MIVMAVAGALVVAGILGVVAEVAGFEVLPRRPRARAVARRSWWQRLSGRTRRLIAAAVVVGALVWVVTGWVLAVVLVPAAVVVVPWLMTSPEGGRDIERLEALEQRLRTGGTGAAERFAASRLGHCRGVWGVECGAANVPDCRGVRGVECGAAVVSDRRGVRGVECGAAVIPNCRNVLGVECSAASWLGHRRGVCGMECGAAVVSDRRGVRSMERGAAVVPDRRYVCGVERSAAVVPARRGVFERGHRAGASAVVPDH